MTQKIGKYKSRCSIWKLIAPAKLSDNRLLDILYIVPHTRQPTIGCLTEERFWRASVYVYVEPSRINKRDNNKWLQRSILHRHTYSDKNRRRQRRFQHQFNEKTILPCAFYLINLIPPTLDSGSRGLLNQGYTLFTFFNDRWLVIVSLL